MRRKAGAVAAGGRDDVVGKIAAARIVTDGGCCESHHLIYCCGVGSVDVVIWIRRIADDSATGRRARSS